jgi:hypothetical protein
VDIAIKAVLVLHFIGLSMLLGGALYQMREKAKTIVRPMLDGAYTQLLTGIILLGLLHASHKGSEPAINDAGFGVKLLIALVIAVLCFVNRNKRTNNVAVWGSVLGLTVVNIIIAVVVSP